MKRLCLCIVGIGCSLAASACSSDSSSPFTSSGGGDPVAHAGAGGVSAGGGSGGSRPVGSGGGDPVGNGGTGGAAGEGGIGGGGGSAGANVAGMSNGGSGGYPPDSLCGQLSGNWQCDQGVIHRVTAGTCEIHLPPDVGPSGSDDDDCEKNSDCTKSANGYCATESGFRGAKNYCLYACTIDADCGTGYACLCGAIGGRCASASCKTDAECNGRYCADYAPAPSLPGVGFACQSANDECVSDADCRVKSPMKPFCGFSGDHRVCSMPAVAEPGVN